MFDMAQFAVEIFAEAAIVGIPRIALEFGVLRVDLLFHFLQMTMMTTARSASGRISGLVTEM